MWIEVKFIISVSPNAKKHKQHLSIANVFNKKKKLTTSLSKSDSNKDIIQLGDEYPIVEQKKATIRTLTT